MPIHELRRELENDLAALGATGAGLVEKLHEPCTLAEMSGICHDMLTVLSDLHVVGYFTMLARENETIDGVAQGAMSAVSEVLLGEIPGALSSHIKAYVASSILTRTMEMVHAAEAADGPAPVVGAA